MSEQRVRRGRGVVPIYRQISDLLRVEIQNFCQAGDALPPEGELAQRFNVNRHTLRRAIDELVNDGLVMRRHGSGVFVLSPAIDYSINAQTRFTATLESQGKTTLSRVLRKQVIPARGGVATRLQVVEGEEVIFLETLREVEGKPFCVIAHFLPLQEVPQVREHYHSGSLHDFLQRECGINVQRSESFISAVMPEPDDAMLLKMPRNLPVLRVKSVNLAIPNLKPVEYVVTRFRGDATQLMVQL
jgi:GntR family phosphonate transport system transcriptional regulator